MLPSTFMDLWLRMISLSAGEIMQEEERVPTPVVPAELDFGDDDAAPEAEAGGAVAEGWGECHVCKNPVKNSLFVPREVRVECLELRRGYVCMCACM
jgi:hypothetical protein